MNARRTRQSGDARRDDEGRREGRMVVAYAVILLMLMLVALVCIQFEIDATLG